jgi:hypothetical protein
MRRRWRSYLLDRVLAASAALAAAVPSVALAGAVPSEFLGSWSPDCADPSAPQLVLEEMLVTVILGDKRHSYPGVEVSHTWYGGAKATGDRVWLLTSKGPNQPFDFIVELTYGKRFLVMENGHPDQGQKLKRLFGPKFLHCGVGRGVQAGPVQQATGTPAGTALDVPVMEQGGDGQMANCVSSRVSGLKEGGDGFLAVRSGPGSEYRKIGELRNGDEVIIFDVRGKWAGIVYATSNVACASTETRPVPYDSKGWVHTKWLQEVAG